MDPLKSAPHEPAATDFVRDVLAPQTMEAIRASLRGLRFGSVNIVVQDGIVIQVDRTEKRRLETNRHNGSA
jgi:hypothetical protein